MTGPKPTSQIFGEFIGGLLVFFAVSLAVSLALAWAAMVCLANVHADAPAVPALGFVACHAAVLLTYFVGLLLLGDVFKRGVDA